MEMLIGAGRFRSLFFISKGRGWGVFRGFIIGVYLGERKGRRGPADRRLIFTTRIKAKKRIRVRNKSRGRFLGLSK